MSEEVDQAIAAMRMLGQLNRDRITDYIAALKAANADLTARLASAEEFHEQAVNENEGIRTLLREAEQRGRALEEAIRAALTAPYDSKAVRILTAALSAPPPGVDKPAATMLGQPISMDELKRISKDGP